MPPMPRWPLACHCGIVAKPDPAAGFNSLVKNQVGVLGPTVKGAGIKL